MEINYIDYSQDLFGEAISSTKPKVYVFKNYASKLEAKEYYQKPFLAKESQFLNFSELEDKLFINDKIVLKEEKRVIIFYQLLTSEEKDKLKINNYNDVIDLANQFFKFYQELNQYQIEKIEALNNWQEEKYQIFTSLWERYSSRLEELNYSDEILNYQEAKFTSTYLEGFEELVFVNILEFSPREKAILNKLEEAGYKLKLYNQIQPQDYDEENLELKSVTLPENLATEVEIYQTNQELLQLISALSKVEDSKQSYTILDADFSNSNYHNLLSKRKVKINKDINFTKTRLYKFLEAVYNLLKNADFSRGELKLCLEDLIEASYLKGFRVYYGLGKDDLAKIKELAQADYHYFCQELIDESLTKFEPILAEVKRINSLNSLEQLCSYLESMELEKLADKRYKDDLTTFYSELAELTTIEELKIVDSWNSYFENTTQGLFLLILNYLKFDNVERKIDDSEAKVEIKDLLTSSFAKRDNIICLNLAEGLLPKKEESSFLLTEEQRAKLGLKTYSKERLKMKYNFFRHLLTAKKVVIYSLKSEAENIAISSFLEELKLKYNLKDKKVELNDSNYPEITKSIFNPKRKLLDLDLRGEDKLKIEEEDFKAGKLFLGYYNYSCLNKCSYKFYLKVLGGLEEEEVEFNKKLSKKVLGILVHQVFAEVVNKAKLKASNSNLEAETVKDVLEDIIASFDLKIPKDYQRYYQDVMFESIQESILYFFTKIKERVDGEIKSLLSEWTPDAEVRKAFIESEKVDIYLSGRVDLLLETEDNYYIIDYKTGGGSSEQLDFYALLCDFTSEKAVKKKIYGVMDKRFDPHEEAGSEEKFAKKLEQLLKEELISSQEYKAQFSSQCKRCNYLDICKVGWK